MCLFPSFAACAEPKQCRAAGPGRGGGVPPSLRCQAGDLGMFFSLCSPSSSCCFPPSPPLFLWNQIRNVSQVLVSQTGSDYKITGTDVGSALTRTHKPPQHGGRGAGRQKTTTTDPPVCRPCPDRASRNPPSLPVPPPRSRPRYPRWRGSGRRPWAARGLGGSGGRYVPTWARSSLFPGLCSGPLSRRSPERSFPAPGPPPASLTLEAGVRGARCLTPKMAVRQRGSGGCGQRRAQPALGPGPGRAARALLRTVPRSPSSPSRAALARPWGGRPAANFAGGKAGGAGQKALSHVAGLRGGRGAPRAAAAARGGEGHSRVPAGLRCGLPAPFCVPRLAAGTGSKLRSPARAGAGGGGGPPGGAPRSPRNFEGSQGSGPAAVEFPRKVRVLTQAPRPSAAAHSQSLAPRGEKSSLPAVPHFPAATSVWDDGLYGSQRAL
ncbi:collagen alpha-2(I) chain-like [Lathamus discolor]|uniref:collagen alpha-2(I) chain-like n=1 Tax=Lathamus discolor TaxID=678569 RepID=UPI0032B7D029